MHHEGEFLAHFQYSMLTATSSELPGALALGTHQGSALDLLEGLQHLPDPQMVGASVRHIIHSTRKTNFTKKKHETW